MMKTIFLVILDGKPHRAFETMEEAWEYSEVNPLAAFSCARVPLMEANWTGKLPDDLPEWHGAPLQFRRPFKAA